MERDERELLLTAAWMFARHGQELRALTLCEALHEDSPRDGVAAAALADLLLGERRADEALRALREADFPSELRRAEALLETRALAMLGRKADAERRWKRYLNSAKGKERNWVG